MAVDVIGREEHPLDDATTEEPRLTLAELRAQAARVQANGVEDEARAIEQR